MSYVMIGDSCTDLTKELKERNAIKLVPLSIDIDNYIIVDDNTFDQGDFLKRVAASPNCPKSSCPAPEAYIEAFGAEGDVYVVTLSGSLSGSYNSAQVAKKMYQEEHPDRNIAIFDSCSASIGQTLIAMKAMELADKGIPFEEVEKMTNEYRDNMKTRFVLESLETLRKNGRLSNLKAIICNALNIKPLMGATQEGTICKLDQARGVEKALKLLAQKLKEEVVDSENKLLGISHCNNYERALYIKEEILKLTPFKEVHIVDTAGISSLYSNDGGIIVCY